MEMYKGKEWLKKETEKLGEVPASGNDYFQGGWFEAYESFNKLIDQLDEPELPVIPQFVADHIEHCKTRYKRLNVALSESHETMMMEHMDISIVEANEVYARAWLDGYTIEQPKLLTVIVKDYETTIMIKQMPEDEVKKMMEGLE